MPILNGRQTGRLRDALVAAFDEDAIEMFLWEKLDRHLLHLVPAKADYPYRVFRLIGRAEAEGWVLHLIRAASAARPEDVALSDLAAEVGQGAGDRDSGVGLERVIIESSGFHDVSAWRTRLAELERQVCRVEIPVSAGTTMGTGFLVGPNLVLTNFHVVRAVDSQNGKPGNVRLRFDHKLAPDGSLVNPGTEYGLADDWLAAWRPPSEVDGLRDPGVRLPGPGELDFALLRLGDCAGSERGWARLTAPSADGLGLGREHPLIVLQHPQDAPLKIAIGQTVGLNGNATRLRHRVNTRRGSSGSPCLNARLEVVALHQTGDPNFDPAHKPEYNTAIPVAAILDCLAGTSVEMELRG